MVGIGTAELFWYGNDPREIPFSSLPNHYVVKLSNGSGSKQVIPISRGINVLTRRPMSPIKIISSIQEMFTSVGDPLNLVFVESFVGRSKDELPDDYKFYCFHGRVQIGYVCIRRYDTLNWFDRHGRWIRKVMHSARGQSSEAMIPDNLNDLIRAAEVLAGAYTFPFVRIDLFNGEIGPIFGEFTHTPLGAELDGYTEYANRIMSQLWDNPMFDYSESLQKVVPR